MESNIAIESPDISIIIPVYNTEAYLRDCINSVINQTITNTEIILVNDGSSDSSPQICDYYASIDNRIRVIHKKNGGLSEARNSGLKISSGKYIAFIDSDDFISENMLSEMYDLAEKRNLEIVSCGYNKVDVNGNFVSENQHPYQGKVLQDDALNEMVRTAHKTRVIWYVWRNLYLKSLLHDNDLCFDKNLRFAEDSIFNLYAFSLATKVGVVNDNLYYYRDSPGSLTQKKGKDYLEENLLIQYSKKLEYYEVFSLNNCITQDLQPYIVEHQLPMILSNAILLENSNSAVLRIRNILKLEMITDSLKEYSLSQIMKLPLGIQIIVIFSKLKLSYLLYLFLKL